MAEVSVSLHGIFPRTEGVVRAWQDYERGRSSRAVAERMEGDLLKEYVTLQHRLDCRPPVFPMNRWLDLLRPFVELVDGLQAGPLTRFLETNTFFRAPVQLSPLRIRRDIVTTWLDTYLPRPIQDGEVKYVLPSPYFFARYLIDSAPFSERVAEVSDVLYELIAFLVQRDGQTSSFVIQFQDPYIGVFGFEDVEARSQLANVFRKITQQFGRPIILHTYFGGSVDTLAQALRLPIATLGIDAAYFAPDVFSQVDWNPEVGLYLGIQEVRSTRSFADELLRKYIEKVLETWAPPHLTLSFNGDPEYLPPDIFIRKVEQLAGLKEIFE